MKLFERKAGCPYRIKEIAAIDYRFPTVLSLPGLTGDDIKTANHMAKTAQVLMGRDCSSPEDVKFLTVQYAMADTLTFNGRIYKENSMFEPVLWDVIKAYNMEEKPSPLSQVKNFVSRSMMPGIDIKNPQESLSKLTFFTYSAGSMFMNMIVDNLRTEMSAKKVPVSVIDDAIGAMKFVNISPVTDVLRTDSSMKGISVINRGDSIIPKAGVDNMRHDVNSSDYTPVMFRENRQMCIFANEAIFPEKRYTVNGEVYTPDENNDPHDIENFFPVVGDDTAMYLNSAIVGAALCGGIQASVDKVTFKSAKEMISSSQQYSFSAGEKRFHENVKPVPRSTLPVKLGF